MAMRFTLFAFMIGSAALAYAEALQHDWAMMLAGALASLAWFLLLINPKVKR